VKAGLLLLVILTAAGCGGGVSAVAVPNGHADRAPALIRAYGCGSCHTISGVDGADGRIGPRLSGLAGKENIAGRLDNTPDNLVRWITEPQQVDPGNLMPDLGVSDEAARDIAAYLYEH
jgi:cytochrome c2